jgi:hypothetical protein
MRTLLSRAVPVACVTVLLAGCSDARIANPIGPVVTPTVSPDYSTAEEYIPWIGNELSFVDDNGVHHRFVANDDAQGKLQSLDVYRNGVYEGTMQNSWSGTSITQRYVTPQYTSAWVTLDGIANYVNSGDQYGPVNTFCRDGDIGCVSTQQARPCGPELEAFARDTTMFFASVVGLVIDMAGKRGNVSRSSVLMAAVAWANWQWSFSKYDRCLKTAPVEA